MTEHVDRIVTTTEHVEIPEGHVRCPFCKGQGQMSKYDEGWHSLVHSAELAALHPCRRCHGVGYITEEEAKW